MVKVCQLYFRNLERPEAFSFKTKTLMNKNISEEDNMLMEMYLEECEINSEEKIEFPECVLSLGEHKIQTKNGELSYPIPIGTKGNFSFIQAPPKTKKTFLISLLSSIYLHGSIDGISGDIKGHRNNNEHVVHFDTEQGHWHSQRVFKRPLEMSNKKVNNYHTLALRRLSHKKRVEFIDWYLSEKLEGKNIGLVIIDGIADLCDDVNNIEQGNFVAQKLMEWTARYNCHIMTVIHSNFGSDKATGHLGSTLYKKTETAISLEKNTVNKDLITVSCKMSRNYSFENFSFKVNKFGLPLVEGAVYDVLKDVKF